LHFLKIGHLVGLLFLEDLSQTVLSERVLLEKGLAGKVLSEREDL
jgi:hypothetical protein